jgi:hypothetical protein
MSSNATFTVATNASAAGIANVLVQDEGEGLLPFSYWACKFNFVGRCNSYYAYELEALNVSQAVKQ